MKRKILIEISEEEFDKVKRGYLDKNHPTITGEEFLLELMDEATMGSKEYKHNNRTNSDETRISGYKSINENLFIAFTIVSVDNAIEEILEKQENGQNKII